LFVYLFVCFESQKQLFSYLATVTIAGDRAANLDLCLFVSFESHEQFLSYMATVTIAGDRAANLDLHVCLAPTAFSSEGSFTCHTYCDT
jgi:hypothetical protein